MQIFPALCGALLVLGTFKPDDPQRRRLVESVRAQQARIDRLNIVSGEQPVGDWANAFATAKVAHRADGVSSGNFGGSFKRS